MQFNESGRDVPRIAALVAACAVLQLALAPNLGLGNGRANFALVFVLCLPMVRPSASPVPAFLAGLFFDLSTTGPVGLMALLLSVAGFVLGAGERSGLSGDLAESGVTAGAVTLAVTLAYHLAMLLVGQADSLLDAVVFRTIPTALLTLVCFAPFYLLLSRTRKQGMGFGRGGGHFSTKGL